MKDLPPWLPFVLTAVGGALIPIVATALHSLAKKIRGDKDPKNDWIADLLDPLADCLSKGDLEGAKAIHAQMASGKK